MNTLLKAIVLNLLIFISFNNFTFANEGDGEPSIRHDEIYDPLEPVNRSISSFNFFIDEVAIRPIVKTYKFIAPDPVEKSISNFFGNLKEPIQVISFIFQGEFVKSLNSAGRFTVNTITSLGTFDLASRIGLTKNETDIGLTLAKNGISSGPYLVLPIYGPTNLRDLSGDIIEFIIDPVSNNISNREYVYIGDAFNERYEVDEEIELIRNSSSDQYEMLKSIYYQNRNSQIEENYVQNLPTPKIYIE